jgi:hypothetical protein
MASWSVAAVLAACASPPVTPLRSVQAPDAAAVVVTDVDAGDDAVAAPSLAPAPALDATSIVGMVGEPEVELVVEGASSVDVPMAADGCVRVAFSAGAPVDVALGPRSAAARTGGVVGENGVVCERAGRTLRLSFSGHGNVRYQVFRTR